MNSDDINVDEYTAWLDQFPVRRVGGGGGYGEWVKHERTRSGDIESLVVNERGDPE